MGNIIFLFLILNLILLEILLNPKIIKYATGGAISTKYLLSLIMINTMENEKYHKPCKNIIYEYHIFFKFLINYKVIE